MRGASLVQMLLTLRRVGWAGAFFLGTPTRLTSSRVLPTVSSRMDRIVVFINS